ncbi:MAG: hypothetical protein SAK29_18185 [Scytonema sp. PMC 1069.18]|nr:hypothetical protein [Scytonema sp. PMC 1069.18]MEC4884530.1 hypothetical protein [Scytonema sp. PMC 1070.18]
MMSIEKNCYQYRGLPPNASVANVRPYQEKLSAWIASQKQDESQLLYGRELRTVQKWVEGKDLNQEDYYFLVFSKLLDKRAREALSHISNYEAVIQSLMLWTRGREKLNKIVFDHAKDALPPKEGDEAEWVCSLIIRQILDNRVSQVPSTLRKELCNSFIVVCVSKLTMISEEDRTAVCKILQEWLPELEKKTRNTYGSVLEEVLLWTKPNPYLIEALLKLICHAEFPSPFQNESNYIKVLVQNYIIDNWEEQKMAQPLRELRDRLLSNQVCDPFWLLLRYRQIWRGTQVKEDGTPQEKELLKLNLVEKIDGKLRVYNLIYQSVFDQSWVDNILAGNSRPYTKELINWLDSNQDSSKLLIGESFQKAKEWFDNNKEILTQHDRNFITLSLLKNTRVL